MIVLAVGLLGFAGQGFKTQGLTWEKAGPGAMMRNLDLVLAFIFQVTILGEEVKALSVVGALITLAASVAMGVLKLRRRGSREGDTQAARIKVTEDAGQDDAAGASGPSPAGASDANGKGGSLHLGVLKKRRSRKSIANNEIAVTLLEGTQKAEATDLGDVGESNGHVR